MKLSNQIKGTTNSKLVPNGLPGYPHAVVASGYAPEGYDNSTRKSIKERHKLGCRQVIVSKSASGEVWVCEEVTSGERRLFPSTVDPEWAGEMAAAEFSGKEF